MYPLVLRQRVVFHYDRFPSTLRQSASIFGIGKSTLARWINPTQGCLKRRQSRFAQVKDVLEAMVSSNPFVTISELCRRIKDAVKPTTMRRYVRTLGFTKKRCRSRHVKSRSTAWTERHAEMLSALESGREVISVDETSVYLSKPAHYGYSRRGERLLCHHDHPVRGNRVSMLLAISNVRGVIGYAVKPGSFNTASFTQFIHDLDAPVGSAILMDNVSFHHSGDTMEAISMKGFTALYTPPYCPELNPVEYSFSVLKNEYSRRFRGLAGGLANSLKTVTLEKVKGFFTHVVKLLNHLVPK
jgi:transposase